MLKIGSATLTLSPIVCRVGCSLLYYTQALGKMRSTTPYPNEKWVAGACFCKMKPCLHSTLLEE